MDGGSKDRTALPDPASVKDVNVVLSVRNLTTTTLTDVSFDLRRGEILGCTGLAGCGHDALARALVGLEPILAGEIIINGRKVDRLSRARSGAWRCAGAGRSQRPGPHHRRIHRRQCESYSVLDQHTRFGVINARALIDLVRRYHKFAHTFGDP